MVRYFVVLGIDQGTSQLLFEFYVSKAIYWNGMVCYASMNRYIGKIERVGDEPR